MKQKAICILASVLWLLGGNMIAQAEESSNPIYNSHIRPAGAPKLPSTGPKGEANFSPGETFIDLWDTDLPTKVYNDWNAFDALGLYEPTFTQLISRVLGGSIKYMPVKEHITGFASAGVLNKKEYYHVIPFCRTDNSSCQGDNYTVDGFLAVSEFENITHPDADHKNLYWMYFRSVAGRKYCILKDEGWTCRPAPFGLKDYDYTFDHTTNAKDVLHTIADAWMSASGISVESVMGGQSSSQPDPYEVRCMMGQNSC